MVGAEGHADVVEVEPAAQEETVMALAVVVLSVRRARRPFFVSLVGGFVSCLLGDLVFGEGCESAVLFTLWFPPFSFFSFFSSFLLSLSF